MPDGSYDLTLKFSDNTFSSRGKRIFDVLVEGKWALRNLDTYAVAGRNTALDVTFTVIVSDGILNFNFLPKVGEAQVNAILITAASGTPKKVPGKIKRYFTAQNRKERAKKPHPDKP